MSLFDSSHLNGCMPFCLQAIELIVEQVAADAVPVPVPEPEAAQAVAGQEALAACDVADDLSPDDAVAIWMAALGIEEGTEGAADPSGVSTAGAPTAAENSAPQTAAKDSNGPKSERPLGRNRKCPCGSKLKYKNCCGGARATAARQSEAAAAAAAEHGPTAGTQTRTLYV